MLLGIAEAGFFPGIIFYLTLWFPAVYRARIIGYFMAAIPLSTVIGAPVSGLLLGMDGVGGLKGWQWLFIIEAAPALILSVVVFFYLTDRPADATWLEPDERAWLVGPAAAGAAPARNGAPLQRDAGAARTRRCWRSAWCTSARWRPTTGLSFFLPQIVKAFGVSNVQAGLVTALPYVVGVVSIVWWGRRSDRKLERRFHLALPAVRGGRRHRAVHRARRPDDEDGGAVDRRLRHLRLPAGVLDACRPRSSPAPRRPAASR